MSPRPTPPRAWRMPLVRRAKRSLQRRILWGLFGAIGATGVTVALVGHALGAPGQDVHDALRGLHAFAAARVADAWSRPDERDALVGQLARAVDAGVTLRSADGTALVAALGGCADPVVTQPVGLDPTRLGTLQVCAADNRRSPLVALGLAGGAACLVLWVAAAALARRLARPIGELAVVAERLGRGEWSARFALDACRPGRGGKPQAPAEVEVLGGAFNTMADRIEAQMRAQKELLAHVSHELRTPLARVRLLTELARDAAPPSAHLDDIDREVEELDAIVGGLLAEARIDFSLVERTHIDAVQVARRALERAGASPAALRTEAPEIKLDADPTLLARALANLLENARTHGDGVDALAVARTADGDVSFVVEDRGPGLPDGDPRALFEPFARRARDADHGSLGLGLSLVRRIAEAHGGRVLAEARSGGGARVGFTLPGPAT